MNLLRRTSLGNGMTKQMTHLKRSNSYLHHTQSSEIQTPISVTSWTLMRPNLQWAQHSVKISLMDDIP